MKIFVNLILFTMFTVGTYTSISSAQEKQSGKVHGYVFGDYFYKVGGDSAQISSSQYSKIAKDFNAFQFRRLYLYYDHTLSEKFVAQFLLEGNDKSLDLGGKIGVFVKTAYLEWKELIPRGSIALGLYPTPTWSWTTEKIWNYRAIEKTVTDFRGLGGASDLGLAIRGKFDAPGRYGYGIMVADGTGQKPENNKYKKLYGVLNAKPLQELILEGYADYEAAATGKNIMTLKWFTALQTKDFTAGVEAVWQKQKKAGPGGDDKTPVGISVFSWASILSEKLNGLARFDFFNPNTNLSDSGFNEFFVVAGLDYMPIKDIHLMPNIWLNVYSDKSPAGLEKDADVVLRLTFFYVYK